MSAPESMATNLDQVFRKCFLCVPAIAPEARQACYRIRHQVYCEEMGYEPSRLDGMEMDKHDGSALHILLYLIEGAVPHPIGCTRLVVSEGPHDPLPMESHGGATLSGLHGRARVAEVSRLAVLSDFRRRTGEAGSTVPLPDIDQQPDFRLRYPYMLVGLCMGALNIANRFGIEQLVMLTEKPLAVRLGRFGVPLDVVGDPVEFRGKRLPSRMRTAEIIDGLSAETAALYRTINNQIEAALWRQMGYAA